MSGLPNVVININNLEVEEPHAVNVEIGSNEVESMIANNKKNGTRVNDKFLQNFHDSSINPSVSNSKESDGESLDSDINLNTVSNGRKNMSYFVHQLLNKRGAEENQKILRKNLFFRTDPKFLDKDNYSNKTSDSFIPPITNLPAEFRKLKDKNMTENQAITLLTMDNDTFSETNNLIGKDNNSLALDKLKVANNITLDLTDFLPHFGNKNLTYFKDNMTLNNDLMTEDIFTSVHSKIPLTHQNHMYFDLKTDLEKGKDLKLCKNESSILYIRSFLNCSHASNFIKKSCKVGANLSNSSEFDAIDSVTLNALKMVSSLFDNKTEEEIRKIYLDKTPKGWKIKINEHEGYLEYEDFFQIIQRFMQNLKILRYI